MTARRQSHGRGKESLLRDYLADIRGTVLLTAVEERALARRIQEGCARSLKKLVEANLPLVVHQVKRFRSSELPLLDLIAEGNLGLLRAAREFDPDRGTRFSTYAAWWIREAVSQLLARCAYAFSMPEKKARAVRRLDATRKRILAEEGLSPESRRLAKEARVDHDELHSLTLAARHLSSLEEDPGVRELGHGGIPGAESRLGEQEKGAQIEQFLARLEPRERLCLRLYFGMPGGPSYSFREIGPLIDLGREGARLLFHRALERLREMPDIVSALEEWVF